MFAINAFQQRDDGIFVEQKPQAQPQHERSENLEFKGSFNLAIINDHKVYQICTHEENKVEQAENVFCTARSYILTHFVVLTEAASGGKF